MSRLKRWRLRRAYKLVYKDLRKVSMFRGVYDARNGDESFMYGIQTVMENVAHGAGEDEYELFNDIFLDNMTYSQIKAGVYNDQEQR